MDESNADFFDTRMAPSGLADWCRLFCSKKNVEPAVPDPNWIGKWSPERWWARGPDGRSHFWSDAGRSNLMWYAWLAAWTNPHTSAIDWQIAHPRMRWIFGITSFNSIESKQNSKEMTTRVFRFFLHPFPGSLREGFAWEAHGGPRWFPCKFVASTRRPRDHHEIPLFSRPNGRSWMRRSRWMLKHFGKKCNFCCTVYSLQSLIFTLCKPP